MYAYWRGVYSQWSCTYLLNVVASVSAINSRGSSTLCVCVSVCCFSRWGYYVDVLHVCVLACLYTYTYIRICCIDALVSFRIESYIPDVGKTLKQNPMHICG